MIYGTLNSTVIVGLDVHQDSIDIDVVCGAGPCGFVIWRHLATKGIACDVVAPSSIPKPAGDRVKRPTGATR